AGIAIAFGTRGARSIRTQQIDEAPDSGAEAVLPAVNDAERPDELAALQVESPKCARPQLLPQRRLGQQGQPRPDLDGLLDRLDVVELRQHLDRYPLLAPEAIDLPANDQPLVESDIL